MASNKSEKIIVENINTPGKTSRVDAAKYTAMKKALMAILPKTEPGLTHQEMQEKVKSHLPESLFPEGKKIAWWSKTVQLDLEAKDLIIRVATKPLTWHQK